MRRVQWLLVPAFVYLAFQLADGSAGIAHAQGGSVKAVFEKHNLLGTFAWDCARPASKDNLYFVNRLMDADHIQRDQMSGPSTRDNVTIIDKAGSRAANEIIVSGTRDGEPAYAIWRLERDRQVAVEANIGGKRLISDGRLLSTGREIPWVNKCD